jgi:hypothetical protein
MAHFCNVVICKYQLSHFKPLDIHADMLTLNEL